ncbi:MAG TPA: hypothetical protein VFR09_00900 [Alphaproteobacteria bacterium]|nr:hypothetical protein [Alphaproteobacteria bacterium]
MAISPVTYSVSAAAYTTTYTVPTTQKANESVSNAVAIGDLAQQGIILDVNEQGTTDGVQTYNFTLGANDNAYLNLNFNNIVDQKTTQIQILDSQGNVIADNDGTAEQQYAFTQLTTTGFTPGAGNYTIQVTPPPDGEAPQLSIGATQQQGTSLSVNSTLTSTDPADYYSFSVGNSSNIKLAFNPAASSPSARVQLYDTSGNLIADSQGNSFQKSEYAALTSGTGLAAGTGNYVVAVSYAGNVDPSTQANLKYNFQLYSGVNYAVVYQSNVAPIAADTSAAGSVKASSDAQSFGRQAYHTVSETATSGVSVGWLQQNKTAINVTSLLTGFDNTNYYNFVMQSGDNLKLSLTNLTNKNANNDIHIQLLNSSGGKVLADNQGSAAQQEAFKELTSSTGLAGNPGDYVVKVTYAQGANKNTNLQYNFQIFSGTTYSSVYNTTASAQNYENAVLSGDISGGYSPFAAAASYLNGIANGQTQDVLSTLQALV